MKYLSQYYIALFVAIILIVLFLTHEITTRSLYKDFITGYWLGDPDFCSESDVQSMQLFIGEPLWGGKRNCHIVIANDIANCGFKISGYGRINNGMQSYYSTIFEDEDDFIWPVDSTIQFDISRGICRIYKDQILYAKLLKQNQISYNVLSSNDDDSEL